MALSAQELVRGFTGENRLHADDLLPDNVSPDAQNCDYRKGTIAKRKGFSRLHATAIKEGGQVIENSASNACIIIPHIFVYEFTKGWTITLRVKLMQLPTDDCTIIGNLDTSTSKGWELRFSPGFRQVYLRLYDTTSTLQEVWASTSLVIGQAHTISAQISDTGSIRCGVDLQMNSKTGDYTLDPSSRDYYVGAGIGATPQNQTISMVVDEIRFWSKYLPFSANSEILSWELGQDKLQDSDLVGYWRLNETRETVYDDLSINRNHAYAYSAGPCPTRGMVPLQEDYGTAIRFNGADDYASAPFNSNFAAILNTGKKWTIEGWFRLDNPYQGAIATLIHIGDGKDGAVDVGYPFRLYVSGGDHSLYYSYSTKTTDTNVAVDSGYDMTPGSPVHLALVRDGTTIRLYINGDVYKTTSGVADEVGPSASTAATNGVYFASEYLLGSGLNMAKMAPVTIDEVRLWSHARSSREIQQWKDRILSDTKNTRLKGYWRFDAFNFLNDEVQGGTDVTIPADGTRPYPSEGLVYAQYPPRLLMVAPLARHLRPNEVKTGATPWDREIVACTRSGIWSLQGDDAVLIKRLNNVGESSLFDWVQLEDCLIFCNGLDVNYKYDGAEKPQGVSIDGPKAAPEGSEGDAGNLSAGTYKYRIAFRNSRDGTESLASPEASVSITASHKAVLTNIPVSTDPQVNQRRIYRTVANGATLRYLIDIDDNTTTTYTDNIGDSTMNVNAVLNEYRGYAGPHRHCEVYGGRLWFGNSSAYPSGLRYSEASAYSDFPEENIILVDRGGGDEITGLKSAHGGLLIFKENSIHYLTGTGATTFQVQKVVDGVGCVSGRTISSGPKGIYYLSHDGVYLLGNDLSPQPIGQTQRPLFEGLSKQNQRYATGVYDYLAGRYIVSVEVDE